MVDAMTETEKQWKGDRMRMNKLAYVHVRHFFHRILWMKISTTLILSIRLPFFSSAWFSRQCVEFRCSKWPLKYSFTTLALHTDMEYYFESYFYEFVGHEFRFPSVIDVRRIEHRSADCRFVEKIIQLLPFSANILVILPKFDKSWQKIILNFEWAPGHHVRVRIFAKVFPAEKNTVTRWMNRSTFAIAYVHHIYGQHVYGKSTKVTTHLRLPPNVRVTALHASTAQMPSACAG